MSKVLLHLMLLPYSSCEKMTTSLLIICMSFVMSADYTMWIQSGRTTEDLFGTVMAYVGREDHHRFYAISINERCIWVAAASESYMWSKVARTVVGHGKNLCVALKFNAACQALTIRGARNDFMR